MGVWWGLKWLEKREREPWQWRHTMMFWSITCQLIHSPLLLIWWVSYPWVGLWWSSNLFNRRGNLYAAAPNILIRPNRLTYCSWEWTRQKWTCRRNYRFFKCCCSVCCTCIICTAVCWIIDAWLICTFAPQCNPSTMSYYKVCGPYVAVTTHN